MYLTSLHNLSFICWILLLAHKEYENKVFQLPLSHHKGTYIKYNHQYCLKNTLLPYPYILQFVNVKNLLHRVSMVYCCSTPDLTLDNLSFLQSHLVTQHLCVAYLYWKNIPFFLFSYHQNCQYTVLVALQNNHSILSSIDTPFHIICLLVLLYNLVSTFAEWYKLQGIVQRATIADYIIECLLTPTSL